MAPEIEQISRRIVLLRMMYRGAKIEISKSDIARALKLIPVHPQLMSSARHVFGSDKARNSSDIVVWFLPLPFGWVASAGFFYLGNQAIPEIHKSIGPQNAYWGPPGAYLSSLFAGGAMFVEPRHGPRPEDIVTEWEWACAGVIAERGIHREEAEEAGFLSTIRTLNGFEVDAGRNNRGPAYQGYRG